MLTNPCAHAATVRAAASAPASPVIRAMASNDRLTDGCSGGLVRLESGRQVREEEPVPVRVRMDEGSVAPRQRPKVGPWVATGRPVDRSALPRSAVTASATARMSAARFGTCL